MQTVGPITRVSFCFMGSGDFAGAWIVAACTPVESDEPKTVAGISAGNSVVVRLRAPPASRDGRSFIVRFFGGGFRLWFL